MLNVESRAFCDYLQDTDEFGITPELEDIEKVSSESIAKLDKDSIVEETEKIVETVIETAEKATQNIINHLETQIDLEQINLDQVQIKLEGGDKMVINPDELKNILNNPEQLKNAIKAHMEGKVNAGTSINDKSRPNFKKVPEIILPKKFDDQIWEDLEEAIMSYNDVVEEIIEYIEEEEDALLDGVKSIEQVLTQHNARTITDFYTAIESLVKNGQPGFKQLSLRDILRP